MLVENRLVFASTFSSLSLRAHGNQPLFLPTLRHTHKNPHARTHLRVIRAYIYTLAPTPLVFFGIYSILQRNGRGGMAFFGITMLLLPLLFRTTMIMRMMVVVLSFMCSRWHFTHIRRHYVRQNSINYNSTRYGMVSHVFF